MEHKVRIIGDKVVDTEYAEITNPLTGDVIKEVCVYCGSIIERTTEYTCAGYDTEEIPYCSNQCSQVLALSDMVREIEESVNQIYSTYYDRTRPMSTEQFSELVREVVISDIQSIAEEEISKVSSNTYYTEKVVLR